MESFCLYLILKMPELPPPDLLFGGILPPTLTNLPFRDAPQVVNRVEVSGWWWPQIQWYFLVLLCCVAWKWFWSVRISTYFAEVRSDYTSNTFCSHLNQIWLFHVSVNRTSHTESNLSLPIAACHNSAQAGVTTRLSRVFSKHDGHEHRR